MIAIDCAILFCAGLLLGAYLNRDEAQEAEELLQLVDARRPAQAPEGPPDAPES